MTKQDELIALCRLGDASAYTALYNQHAAAAYNTILRLVVHTGEAEDILQETFVAVFEGLDRYKDNGGLASWIKRIAINKSVDSIRKRKLRLVEFEDGLAPEEEEEVTDETAFAFTIGAVNEAIAALPEGYRTVFNLFAVENIPQAEIARLLGIEHAAVRTQYHRAKQKILHTLQAGGHYEK